MPDPEEKRPTCRRCFRPEASQEDWDTVPLNACGGEHMCWGYRYNCEDRRDERIRDLEKLTLIPHLQRQREWSEKTFGPGARTAGIIQHIRKELDEITENERDIFEWIDVVILALDGAWRAGWEPDQIAQALHDKQTTNELREWPDWRQFTEGEAIEHVKSTTPQEPTHD